MHVFETEVYYEDTDMGGIVYHANYLKFIERARSAFVRDLGVDQRALKRDEGLAFVVRAINAEFLRPAYLEDHLRVETRVESASGARLRLHQSVWRTETEVFRATVDLVAMRDSGQPTRLPATLRKALGGALPA